MYPDSTGKRLDLFCQVIDNFGDAGVCWRLARQLAGEYGFRVKLWVDKPAVLQKICPEIVPDRNEQEVAGVSVVRWPEVFPSVSTDDIPDVVVEGFGARLPESYVRRMAERPHAPVWLNLEYLSAESWVGESHLMASPQSWIPLTKYFYFPGFSANTGGLIREAGLFAERDAWQADSSAMSRFLLQGMADGAKDTERPLLVSLFCYPDAPVLSLFDLFGRCGQEVVCLVPEGVASAVLASFMQRSAQVGNRFRKGALTVRILPMVPQANYDRLLWSCDLNFIRGEDSFVRAQWAARPFVWHIYPQEEDAHRVKLDAFLDCYLPGLPTAHAETVRCFWYGWNGFDGMRCDGETGEKFLEILPSLKQYNRDWAKKLALHADLASGLVRFINTLR